MAHSDTAVLRTQATLVAARLGDTRLTLELAARAVRLLHWNGDRAQLAGILNVVAWAAAATEPDDAAKLQGAARRLALAAIAGQGTADGAPESASGSPSASGGLISELRRETTRRLAEGLGDERLRDLRAEGEAMDTDRAVAHALALAERALAHP
jgi:hypothetical protein